jgi:superfamily II DNA or RNA helicase
MQLRKYQEEARSSILSGFDAGLHRLLLVLPTGTGKTIVFSSVIEEEVRRGGRALILAHREELLQQAADKLERVSGLGCAVEKAADTAQDSWFRVTVGSVQTLMREKRLARFSPDHYTLIVVDEAHHILADSYRRVVDYFGGAKLLGVTATPDRGDKRNLGAVFEDIAYEYTLPRAIAEGHLCKIKALTIPLNIDIRGVGTAQGDYKAGDLGSALDPYLDRIADEMLEHCQGRKVVCFLPLVATSQKFRSLLAAKGFKAWEVNGDSPDRAATLQAFHDAKEGVLCNSMLLTEGWDEPGVDCIVNLRATKIRSLYCQIVGRGTRPAPGKEHLLLLDFLWQSQTHDLCRPAHLICESEEVANKAAEILAGYPGGEDLQEAVEKAESDVVKDREAALAAKLAEQRKKKRALVDPLQFEYSIQAEDLIDYQPTMPHEMAPPSTNQLALLEKSGIFPDEVTCAGLASKLLDKLKKRRAEELATPKQIRFLEGRGFRHVGTWKFEHARKAIDRIAANGWKVPASVNPATYQPGA